MLALVLSTALLLGTAVEGTGRAQAETSSAVSGAATTVSGTAVATATPTATPTPVDTSKIALSKTTLTLMAKKTYSLAITGTTSTVTWTSEDESIATVDENGVVKGIKKGTTNVVAAVDGVSFTCAVTIVPKMRKKDFNRFGITTVSYYGSKRKVKVRKINFVYQCQKQGYDNKGGYYYTFQFKNGSGKRRYTYRGIKTGTKLSTLKKKYGEQLTIKKVSKKDAFCNMKLVKTNKAKKYTQVGYGKYKIRFFINKKNKVVGIILVCNIKNIKKKYLKADGYI